MSDWVTIDSLPHEALAQLWRDRLERADIPCQLRGRGAASTAGAFYPINTSWSNLLGGIEVLVRREDLLTARRILGLGSSRRVRSSQRWVEAFWIRAIIMFGLSCSAGMLVFALSQNPYVAISAVLILFAVMLWLGRPPCDTS